MKWKHIDLNIFSLFLLPWIHFKTKNMISNFYKLVCTPCFRIVTYCSYKSTHSSELYKGSTLTAVPLAYSEYLIQRENLDKESPIYILHGILGSRNNWNSMAKKIAAKTNRKVVAVDLRNHGDSPHTDEFSYSHMVIDLKKLLMEQNIFGKASVVGHSIGGRAAMALALEHPTAIKDLVIVDVSPVSLPESIHSVPRLLSAIEAVAVKEGISLSEARKMANEQMKRYIRGENLRKWLLQNLILDEETNKFVWRLNVKSIKENFSSLLTFPTFSNVYNRPCLFVAGESSNYLRRNDEGEIKKMFPNSSFIYVPDAGHVLHHEQPKIFLEIICDFLDKQMVIRNK